MRLKSGSDPQKIESRLNGLLDQVEADHPNMKGLKVSLQEISTIHLTSHLKEELEFNSSKGLMYILSTTALLILVMAWINYINIESARLIARAKEVSIKRIIGSQKSFLSLQFLVEYLLIFLIAVFFAIVLVYVALPLLSDITGVAMTSLLRPSLTTWLFVVPLILIGSLIVGIYPSFFILKLNPVTMLKGGVIKAGLGKFAKRSLIIVQFSFSMILVGFILVIYRQLSFMQTADNKIELQRVVSISNPTAYSNENGDKKHDDFTVFENNLMQNSFVEFVSSSSAIPGSEIGFTNVDRFKRNVGDPFDPTRFKLLFVNYKFVPVFGLKMVEGRNFDKKTRRMKIGRH